MPLIYLVRHARPVAAWGREVDPGIDAEGNQQAEETARFISAGIGRADIYASPLLRCRETARPLEQLWKQPATIIDAVAEIPSPDMDPVDKLAWLRQASAGTWRELVSISPPGSPDFLKWRRNLLEALLSLPGNSVIFTHFIAINVAVAATLSSESVLVFRPDYCSVSCIEVLNGKLRLIEKGREADTKVLTRG